MELHLRGAEWYINNALRPGTQANHLSVLKMFINFTCKFSLDFRRVTVPLLCAFIHNLTVLHKNPNTILNYVSNLCAVLKRLGLDTSAFRAVDVMDFISSIKVNIRHIPNRRQPVSHEMLATIVDFARRDPHGPTVTFAYIILFFTMLRQSNIAPRTSRAFDASRQLTRGDVIPQHDAIIIGLKWSKTRQGPTASSVAAPALPGNDICPLRAYRDMVQHVPTTHDSQPLLCFTDLRPMPASYLNKVWDRCMSAIGVAKRHYTLHSLRRGAATEVYSDSPASIDQIKRHGDWTSSAVFSYLPHDPRNSEVYRHFQTLT